MRIKPTGKPGCKYCDVSVIPVLWWRSIKKKELYSRSGIVRRLSEGLVKDLRRIQY